MCGKTPLSESIYSDIAREKRLGAWNGVLALYGAREEVGAAKKVIGRVLAGKVSRLNFVSDQRLALLERFPALFSFIMRMNIPELLKVLKRSYGIMRGKPSEVSLSTPYWRMHKLPPDQNINPAMDSCGLIWLAPVVPMKKENAFEFIGMIRPILAKYHFEDCITFTTVNPRSFDCNLPILYNRDDSEETERAVLCHEELMRECIARGYIPYRFGVQSMSGLVDEGDVFWGVVGKIKEALDPKGMLSPGRYSR